MSGEPLRGSSRTELRGEHVLMSAHQASQEAKQTCALRALTICDGQQLELPDGALASCLCWLEERSREAGYRGVAEACARERIDLLERPETY